MNFLNNFFNRKGVKVFDQFFSQNSITKIIAFDIRNIDNPKHFILDNPVTLAKVMQKKWAFLPSEGICRGGYDYSIVFFEQEKQVNHSLICFLCNALTFQSEIYGIKKNSILDLLKTNFSRLYQQIKVFKDKEVGRKYWSTIKDRTDLVMLESQAPRWLYYEGEFGVSFPVDKSLSSQSEKTKEILIEKLKQFDSTEKFDVSYSYSAGNDDEIQHGFSVYGSEKLFDQIENLNKISWRKFTEFKLPLYSKNEFDT